MLREGRLQDVSFLHKMLFEAAFWRPTMTRPRMDAGLSHPALAKLLNAWGREGDASVIAETTGDHPVGATWYRFWSDQTHSYGYVSADIPELGIAVVPSMRRQGIGSRLLQAIRALAAERGIAHLSLSVEEDNPARHLYVKHGFAPMERVGNAWTMVGSTTV